MTDRSSISPPTCIFCGSEQNVTKEHVIPDWVKHVLNHPKDGFTELGFKNFALDHETVFIQPSVYLRQGKIGNRTLAKVCAICNNGWMSKLQNSVKPIIAPLIQGKWLSFDPQHASTIAVWLAMTVSVIAMSYEETLGVTFSDRQHLAKTKSVPPRWLMWVGRGSGFDGMAYSNRVMTFMRQDEMGPLEPNLAITTIVLGQLILHAVNVPMDEFVRDPAEYALEYDIFPIYPWVNDSGLDWRWIPIIRADSHDFFRLKNDFYWALHRNDADGS